MRVIFRSFLIVAALIIAPAAQAQWTGKAELGLLYASGNSESKSANGKLDLTHEGANWKQNVNAAALYGENGEFATAERYELSYKVDRKISARFSWFVAARAEDDRFSGFAYQQTLSTGATYKFLDSQDTQWDGSLGVGYRRLQFQTPAGDGLDPIPGEKDSEPVVTLGSNYEHAFTETTKITNKFLAESGSDNTSIGDDLALQVSMSQKLALAVGIAVRYNTDPPPPAVDTDTQFTVNLVYNIK